MNKVLARDTSVDASNKNLKNFVIGMYNFVTGNSKSTIHFSRVEKSFSTDCIYGLFKFQRGNPGANAHAHRREHASTVRRMGNDEVSRSPSAQGARRESRFTVGLVDVAKFGHFRRLLLHAANFFC